MTVTLELPPDVEVSISYLAHAKQIAVNDYALWLLTEKAREAQAQWEDEAGEITLAQYQAHFGHEEPPAPEAIIAELQESMEDFAAGRSYTLEECIALADERYCRNGLMITDS